MSLFDRIAELPLVVEEYALDRLERNVSSGFTRVSTVVKLFGAGTEGVGEDVVYDAVDHDVLQEAGPVLPLAGDWTLGDFCDQVERLDRSRSHRSARSRAATGIWTFESAALDLALRQAGKPLHEVLGREPKPVRFVVSLRLGSEDVPSSIAPLREPARPLPGPAVQARPDARLGRRARRRDRRHRRRRERRLQGPVPRHRRRRPGRPGALRARARGAARGRGSRTRTRRRDHRAARAPPGPRQLGRDIHSVADIEALPFQPKMVNVKPSRLGRCASCSPPTTTARPTASACTAAGSSSSAPGRGQIQYLASLFHADAPNDTAPSGYNAPDVPAGLPESPLPAQPSGVGFRWG